MKNPERPDNMDNIISECINKKTPEKPQPNKPEEEIIKAVFGE